MGPVVASAPHALFDASARVLHRQRNPAYILEKCMDIAQNVGSARPVITEEMLDAGFSVLSASGIADDYLGADRLLVGDIFAAMLAVQASDQKRRSEACLSPE